MTDRKILKGGVISHLEAVNYCVINLKRKCRRKLKEVGRNNKVSLVWVLGHSGIKGNEEANTLARKEAQTPLTGPEHFCGIGKCTYKKKFLEKKESDKEKLWRNLPRNSFGTLKLQGP